MCHHHQHPSGRRGASNGFAVHQVDSVPALEQNIYSWNHGFAVENPFNPCTLNAHGRLGQTLAGSESEPFPFSTSRIPRSFKQTQSSHRVNFLAVSWCIHLPWPQGRNSSSFNSFFLKSSILSTGDPPPASTIGSCGTNFNFKLRYALESANPSSCTLEIYRFIKNIKNHKMKGASESYY